MLRLGCYTNNFVNKSKAPGQMTPEELKDECLARAKDWNSLLRDLVNEALHAKLCRCIVCQNAGSD